MKKMTIVGLLLMMLTTTLVLGQKKKSFTAFGCKMNKSYKCSHVGIQKIRNGKFKKKALSEIKATYAETIASLTAVNNDTEKSAIAESDYSLHKTVYSMDSAYTPELPLPTPVYFRFDTDELTYADLRQIFLASEHAKMGKLIKLEGHTDYMGTDHYNHHLSLKRANKIKAMMVDLGVDANAISVTGHGESKPATLEISDKHRQLNRRVEFVVMNKK
ncbi:MAG: OmpA family protein [Cytophagaceae bacterium]